jgi:excisionase family DNA binding protein
MAEKQGERKVLSVIEAGRLLGLGKNGAYEAAHRGELPVVRIGRRLLVPVVALERMLAEAGKRPEVRP